MLLTTALKNNPAIAAAFSERSRPETKSSELAAWLKSLPELSGVYVPDNLAPIRRKFGAPGKQGGWRGNRGSISYTVAARGRKERA